MRSGLHSKFLSRASTRVTERIPKVQKQLLILQFKFKKNVSEVTNHQHAVSEFGISLFSLPYVIRCNEMVHDPKIFISRGLRRPV